MPDLKSRRSLLAGGVALPAAALGAAPLQTAHAIPKQRITRVQTVEVREVVTGKGLVLPWDPKKIPQDTRDYVITQFLTDGGLVGTTMDGEYKLPAGIGAEIQERAQAYFTGKDPFDIEVHNAEFFWRQKSRNRTFYLEIGLWDLIGKAVGLPLWRLWGAASSKIRPYAATVHFNKSVEERADDARKFYDLGFRAIKLRLHHEDPKDDLRLAEGVMKAAGGRTAVMFDANQAGKRKGDPPPVWDVETASMMARELDNMGVYWLEEPLNRMAFDELARVRRQAKRMHLAGGEGNVGLHDFREYLARGSYSYLQPDPVQSGTMTTLRKIAAMAEAYGVPIGPHHGKSGVGMMANLHLQCAIPNTGYLEYMYDPGFWNADGFQAGFVAPYPVDKAGFIHAPEKPGLGIEWDRAFFKKNGLVLG